MEEVWKNVLKSLSSGNVIVKSVSVWREHLVEVSFVCGFRLGGTLYSFHSSILNCLLPQLMSPRLAVRKRAIIALGHLVLTCNGNIFAELMEHLLSELKRNNSTSTTRTYIQCIAGISKQAGHRIGKPGGLDFYLVFWPVMAVSTTVVLCPLLIPRNSIQSCLAFLMSYSPCSLFNAYCALNINCCRKCLEFLRGWA